MDNGNHDLLQQVETLVAEMEVGASKWISPSSLRLTIKQFQCIAPLLKQMEIDGHIAIVGQPHRESSTGKRDIDNVMIKRRR